LTILSRRSTENLSFSLLGEDGEGQAEEGKGEVVEFWRRELIAKIGTMN